MSLHEMQAKQFQVIKAMHPLMLDEAAFIKSHSKKMAVRGEEDDSEAWNKRLHSFAKARIDDTRRTAAGLR
jgi:hypothetical protein